MFCFMFGWRKASKCKKLIRHVQCRLKLLKNKRESILRQSSETIVQLIKKGQDHCAFIRVEQLFLDQTMKDVYELLENFCEFLLFQLPYIRSHKDCPNDISEAISSLLFASARCGHLPELKKLRELFLERYGRTYVTTAVELLPGNLVNHQITEKLSIETISDNIKFKLMKDLAREHHLQLQPPDIERQQLQVYDLSSQKDELVWEEQELDRETQSAHDDTGGAQLQIVPLSPDPIAASSPRCEPINKHVVAEGNHKEFEQLRETGRILESTYSPNNAESGYSNQLTYPFLFPKVDRTREASLGSSFMICEKSILYLDDIEEFPPGVKEDVSDKDQRVFTFKLSIPRLGKKEDGGANRESSLDSYHNRYTEHYTNSCDSMKSRKSRKSSTKKFKRKYVIMESHQLCRSPISLAVRANDAGSTLYYGETSDNSQEDFVSTRSHKKRNHQRKKKNRKSHSLGFNCSRKKLHCPNKKQEEVHRCKLDDDVECCLDHPCYFFIIEDKNDLGLSLSKGKSSNGCKVTSRGMEDEEKDLTLAAQKPSVRRNCKDTEQSEVEELAISDYRATYPSSCGSCSREMSPWSQPPAWPTSPNSVILPPDQAMGKMSHQNLWSSSLYQLQQKQPCYSSRSSSSSSCSHVHPKLPDYDDLVTKFKALKLERLQNSSVSLGTAW